MFPVKLPQKHLIQRQKHLINLANKVVIRGKSADYPKFIDMLFGTWDVRLGT